MHVGYLLVLNGTFLVDCCEARKRDLEKDEKWRVVVLIRKENVKEKRHCPGWLGCLKEGVKTDAR